MQRQCVEPDVFSYHAAFSAKEKEWTEICKLEEDQLAVLPESLGQLAVPLIEADPRSRR